MISFSMLSKIILLSATATAVSRRRKVANDPACPNTQPTTGDPCHSDLTCQYGSEQCFGFEFYSYKAQCLAGAGWAVLPTEACRSAPTFRKVGDGFCRSHDLGLFLEVDAPTVELCEAECAREQACEGYEFGFKFGQKCELHLSRPTFVQEVGGPLVLVACFAKVPFGESVIIIDERRLEETDLLPTSEPTELIPALDDVEDDVETVDETVSTVVSTEPTYDGEPVKIVDDVEDVAQASEISELWTTINQLTQRLAVLSTKTPANSEPVSFELVPETYDHETPASDGRRRTIANDPACPAEEPRSGERCNSAQLDKDCNYGEEMCFGRPQPAYLAQCPDGFWAVRPTTTCRDAPKFIKLGLGLCRTNGRRGTFTEYLPGSYKSFVDCEGACQLREDCLGFEFVATKYGHCELHHEKPTSVRRARDAVCMVKIPLL